MAHEHVWYELTRTAFYAMQVPSPYLLECYMLHARNVNDFLATPIAGAAKGELVAGHYFEDAWRCDPKPLSGVEIGTINNRIAHLNVQRLDRNFEWNRRGDDYTDIATRILTSFDRFLTDLAEPHPERVSWFNDASRIAHELLNATIQDAPEATPLT